MDRLAASNFFPKNKHLLKASRIAKPHASLRGHFLRLPRWEVFLNVLPSPLTGFEPTFKVFVMLRNFAINMRWACALEGEMQISQFGRIAQNCAVRVSEFVRKTMAGFLRLPDMIGWVSQYQSETAIELCEFLQWLTLR